MLERGLHTLRSLLKLTWDLTIHSLEGLTFSLTHYSISTFNTICNDPSPPLTDIVLFALPLSYFILRF